MKKEIKQSFSLSEDDVYILKKMYIHSIGHVGSYYTDKAKEIIMRLAFEFGCCEGHDGGGGNNVTIKRITLK